MYISITSHRSEASRGSMMPSHAALASCRNKKKVLKKIKACDNGEITTIQPNTLIKKCFIKVQHTLQLFFHSVVVEGNHSQSHYIWTSKDAPNVNKCLLHCTKLPCTHVAHKYRAKTFDYVIVLALT